MSACVALGADGHLLSSWRFATGWSIATGLSGEASDGREYAAQTRATDSTRIMPNSRPTEDSALLKAFYETHPNHMTALRQAPYMIAWYAFPGGEAFQFGDNH
jgi:hypothetical protein